MGSSRLDAARSALADAERRLCTSLGLDATSRQLALTAGPVEHARVIEVGDGPPLLFVHGGGMAAAVWLPLLAHLSHRRCIAVDLPGCGLTDPFDHRGIDLRQHGCTFLTALLTALELDRVPVVANSLGSTYCLYLAASDPHRLSHLVLLGAPGVALPGSRGSLAMALYSRPALGRLVSAISPRVTPTLARRMLAGICGRDAVEAVPDALFDAMAAAITVSQAATRTLMPELFVGRTPRAHLSLSDDELARVTVPTHFIWGAHDIFQAPDAGRRAVARMPAASMTVVKGGHHPWWDDAGTCAALVADHTAGRRPDRPPSGAHDG